MYSIRAKHSREPELRDLIKYVDKETALVSDLLFSKEAVEQYSDKRDIKVDNRRRVGSYEIRSEEESKNKPDKDTKEKDKCVMCAAFHDLDDCSVFIPLTAEDRNKVHFKNKLCYGCYGCISVQGTVNSEDHVRYVRKNIQLAYLDSNLRKKE